MRFTRKDFLKLSLTAGAGVALLPITRRKEAVAAPVAENALENQTFQMYDEWFAWLNRAGVPGYVGETITPNSNNDTSWWSLEETQKWMTLLEKVYQKFDEAGPTVAAVTAHCAGLGSSDSNGFQVYGPNSTSVSLGQRTFVVNGETVSVVEGHPTTPTSLRGMNLSAGPMGADFPYSSQSSGTEGNEYDYPDRADCDFLYARGHRLIRLGFLWERIQHRTSGNPTGNPTLDADELNKLRAACNAADAAGLKVVLDVHNYASYQFTSFSSAKLGSKALPLNTLGKLWAKLATQFKDHPAVVGYDIMNEPMSMPTADPAGLWESCAQQTVNSIAAVDTQTRIWIPGYHTRATGSYNGLYSFIAHHPNPFITSNALFGYTTHCYYGPGAGYNKTYDEVVADWAEKGY